MQLTFLVCSQHCCWLGILRHVQLSLQRPRLMHTLWRWRRARQVISAQQELHVNIKYGQRYRAIAFLTGHSAACGSMPPNHC